jgi:hypothetical protein
VGVNTRFDFFNDYFSQIRNERLSFSTEIKFDFERICTLFAVQLNLIPTYARIFLRRPPVNSFDKFKFTGSSKPVVKVPYFLFSLSNLCVLFKVLIKIWYFTPGNILRISMDDC